MLKRLIFELRHVYLIHIRTYTHTRTNDLTPLWAKPSVGIVQEIFSEGIKKTNENETCELSREIKSAKYEGLSWVGQENKKNGKAADEVVKEQAELIGELMSVPSFVKKYIFCSKRK